jgi:hypothetical protein
MGIKVEVYDRKPYSTTLTGLFPVSAFFIRGIEGYILKGRK